MFNFPPLPLRRLRGRLGAHQRIHRTQYSKQQEPRRSGDEREEQHQEHHHLGDRCGGSGEGDAGGGGGGGVYPMFSCVRHFTIDHASLRDGAPFLLLIEAPPNVWVLITYIPFST